jgi:D-alanyl-D-alanine carboxypeptidase/D-alanyl-D-alanine-endopeptidase (penicillin-binding protein 4)
VGRRLFSWRMRRTFATALVLTALWPASALAQSSDGSLQSTLDRPMGAAGVASGAYVLDSGANRVLYERRADTPRVLASNTKLFTTAAVLGRIGPEATLPTRALAAGAPSDGVLSGDLYLRGGGDPTFGSAGSASTSVEALAERVRAAGVTRVSGRVVGDEGLFDSRRGGPASGFATSGYVGPLSALSFNRGRASGGGFQSNPPLTAATALDRALERRGVSVTGSPRGGSAPAEAAELARVESPSLARLALLTNKPSDNFFAETLLKGLGARVGGAGTTATGARQAAAYARGLGAPARLADGSGLSRANRASPRSVGRLLNAMRSTPAASAYASSLAVAGQDGTLGSRLRGGPAAGRCRGKTGSLSGVSTLSGYCRTVTGGTLAFSILMNNVSPSGARRLQDRMVQALAGYRGATPTADPAAGDAGGITGARTP